jgi:2-polyprenyl-3-methyl-5-hydroxy-6-metoxy-1,4-benzoquinol methylase
MIVNKGIPFKAEFDAFASGYQDLVTESVRISGESSDYFAAYKARYLGRILERASVRYVLDYGCGVGSLAKHLHAQLPLERIDGYDPSADSIRRVEDCLRRQGIYSNSLQALGTSYDLIVLANVLHHVKPEGRQALLRNIICRLRPNGRLVVFEHNPYNPLTRWAVSRCVFDEDAVLLRRSETQHRLRAAGFDILRRDFIVFFPRFLAALRPMEALLDWCPMGAQYVLHGIKISASPSR